MKQPNEPVSQQNANTDKLPKGNSMGGQVHNILMDEFKKAHKKMFKNGFVENEYQQLKSNDGTTLITSLDSNEQILEVSRY